jgi:hypothetical protein
LKTELTAFRTENGQNTANAANAIVAGTDRTTDAVKQGAAKQAEAARLAVMRSVA